MRVFLLLAGLSCAVSQNGDVKKDLDAMQGEWMIQWNERDGRKTDFKPGSSYTIRGNKYCQGKRELIVLKLDPTCKPKVLDLTFVDEEDRAKGETAEGIYKIEGDSMVWCWNYGDGIKDRPLEFKTALGSKRVIFAFVRVKR